MSSLLKLFYSSCSKWMLPATEGVGTDRLSVGKVQRRHQLVTFTNFSFYRSMSSVWHTKCGLLKSYLFYDVCGIMWRLNVMLKAVFVHQIQNLLNLSLESRKRKVHNKSGMRSCFQMSSFYFRCAGTSGPVPGPERHAHCAEGCGERPAPLAPSCGSAGSVQSPLGAGARWVYLFLYKSRDRGPKS